ncbi:MAG: cytochrome c biogenesis protein CcdA [Candidatus Bathyarchaeota archaeon]
MKGFAFILILLVFSFSISGGQASPDVRTVIYGRGCLGCFLAYVQELRQALSEIGVSDVELHYLETDPEGVEQLASLRGRLKVPENMQGSVTVNFGDTFLFEGYMPVEIIIDFLANHTQAFSTLVVFRDELRDTYKLGDEEGNFWECEIENSITECGGQPITSSLASVVTLIVVSGLLDGINPCAFAVLLFFLSLLSAYGTRIPQQDTRRKILTTGCVYILGVYLSYLAIGLSLIKLIGFSPFPHLIAMLGSFAMISFGLLNIVGYLWPHSSLGPGISLSRWEKIRNLMYKFNYPATFILGVTVAFLEFPCTGGIYFAILGLVALKSTFLEGFTYLTLYNIAFVFPLLVILVVASNKKILRFSITQWKGREHKTLKLFSGTVMVALGVLLLFFVI